MLQVATCGGRRLDRSQERCAAATMENVTVREEIEPDVALYGLSRRKQGFETPTGRQQNQVLALQGVRIAQRMPDIWAA